MKGEAIAEAIYAALGSASSLTALLPDGTAGIHYAQAPENAEHPLVLYYAVSDVPSYRLGKSRAYTEHRFTVEAITEGPSFAVAKQIADAADAALSDSILSVSGVNAIAIERVGAIPDRPEVAGGSRFNHVGYDFRAVVAA